MLDIPDQAKHFSLHLFGGIHSCMPFPASPLWVLISFSDSYKFCAYFSDNLFQSVANASTASFFFHFCFENTTVLAGHVLNILFFL